MGKNLHELVGGLREEIGKQGFNARYYFSVKSENNFYGIIFVKGEKGEKKFIDFLVRKIGDRHLPDLDVLYEPIRQGPTEAHALVISPFEGLTESVLVGKLGRVVKDIKKEVRNWEMQNR